jgi:hypothetical protein
MATSIRKIVDQIAEYAEIKTEQIKLKFITRVSRLLATVLSLVLIGMLGLLFLLFLSLSVGEMINEALYSKYLGYLIVTGIYFILIIIVLLLARAKKIRGWFEKLILYLAEQENEQDA